MNQFYKAGDFKKYFDENMKALRLPVPSTFFDSYNATIAHVAVMLEALKTLGKGATVGELIGATTGLEKLKVAAAFGAAAYVGAVIGSIVVATGRCLSGGYQISDMFVFLHQNNLEFVGWHNFFIHNPQVLAGSHPLKQNFGIRAQNSPTSFEFSL